MKNKKTIIGILILVMTLSVVYIASNIGAWLTDQDETGEIVLTVGKVEYTLDNISTIPVQGFKVPGENLVQGNTLTIKNSSSVNSEIRFSYEFTDETGANAKNLLLSENALFSSHWVHNGTDNNYYLNAGSPLSPIIKSDMVTPFSIIESLVLNGAIVGNDYATKSFTLKIIFQAKQADHLKWSEAGSIDFALGR